MCLAVGRALDHVNERQQRLPGPARGTGEGEGRPPEVDVRRMTNAGKPGDALGERGHKRCVFNDLWGEFEQLDLFSGFGVNAGKSLAKPVGDRRRGRDSWEHSIHACNGPSKNVRMCRRYANPR